MATVRYDLDGSSDTLVAALNGAVNAMQEAAAQSRRTADAVDKLTDGMKQSGEQANKAGKGFSQFAADAAHVVEVTKSTVEWVKWLAEGFVAVIQRGIEAREAVKDFITPEDNARVRDLGEQTERLSDAMDVLSVRIAADLAPELTSFINLVIGAADAGGDLLDWMRDVAESPFAQNLKTAGDALRQIVSLGLASKVDDAMADMVDHGKQVNDELQTMQLGWMRIAKPTAEQREQFMRLEEELAARLKARQEAQEASAKADAEASAEAARAREEVLRNLADQMALEQAVADSYIRAWSGAYDTQLQQIRTGADAAKAAADQAAETWEASVAKWSADWERQQEQLIGGLEALGQTAADGVLLVFDAMAQQANDELDRVEARANDQQQRVDDLRARAKAGDQAAQAALEAEEKKLKQMRDAEKAWRRYAFEADQTNKIASAVMAGALAVVQAFAQLGPIGGALATTGITAMTAAQVGVIEAQKPPMHGGGYLGADEGMMFGRLLRQGEGLAVVNQRGAETVDRINRDQNGGSSSARLVLEDAGRVLGDALMRSSNRPGSPVYAASSTGATDPYRSSR